jgi:hypothetical protein
MAPAITYVQVIVQVVTVTISLLLLLHSIATPRSLSHLPYPGSGDAGWPLGAALVEASKLPDMMRPIGRRRGTGLLGLLYLGTSSGVPASAAAPDITFAGSKDNSTDSNASPAAARAHATLHSMHYDASGGKGVTSGDARMHCIICEAVIAGVLLALAVSFCVIVRNAGAPPSLLSRMSVPRIGKGLTGPRLPLVRAKSTSRLAQLGSE